MNMKQIFYRIPPEPFYLIFHLHECVLDYEDDEGRRATMIFLAAFNKIFNSIIACEVTF